MSSWWKLGRFFWPICENRQKRRNCVVFSTFRHRSCICLQTETEIFLWRNPERSNCANSLGNTGVGGGESENAKAWKSHLSLPFLICFAKCCQGNTAQRLCDRCVVKFFVRWNKKRSEYLMYSRAFLWNMTGNLQADGVQSRQTLFVRYCPRISLHFRGGGPAKLVEGFFREVLYMM